VSDCQTPFPASKIDPPGDHHGFGRHIRAHEEGPARPLVEIEQAPRSPLLPGRITRLALRDGMRKHHPLYIKVRNRGKPDAESHKISKKDPILRNLGILGHLVDRKCDLNAPFARARKLFPERKGVRIPGTFFRPSLPTIESLQRILEPKPVKANHNGDDGEHGNSSK
jgi:hypothetical protein